jgi:hypothetical protein
MQYDLTFVISIAAIAVMLYCLYLIVSLKKDVPGGIVGKKWNFLTILVVLFTGGYMASPFFNMLPENILRLIVGLIFFFGAIYVVITVKLIYRIIEALAD